MKLSIGNNEYKAEVINLAGEQTGSAGSYRASLPETLCKIDDFLYIFA